LKVSLKTHFDNQEFKDFAKGFIRLSTFQ